MLHAFQQASHVQSGLTLAEQLQRLRAELPVGPPMEVPNEPPQPGEMPPEEVPPISDPPIQPEMPVPARWLDYPHAD